MRKVFTLLLSILFVCGSFAQMVVHGDVVNIKNVKVYDDLIINAAEHSGTSTTATGVFENKTATGNVTVTNGNLVLRSVSYERDGNNSAKGADGIYFNAPTATTTVGTTNAKVVKQFKEAGYYFFTLPFDVAANSITSTATHYCPASDTETQNGYWLYSHSTANRAANGKDGSAWVGFTGSDTHPALKAGETYSIWIDAPDILTFTASSTSGLFGATGTGHHTLLGDDLAYAPGVQSTQSGWNYVGAKQTAPFHLNVSASTSNIEITGVTNVYVFNPASHVWESHKIEAAGTENGLVSIAPYGAGIAFQLPEDQPNVIFKGTGRQTRGVTGANNHLRSAVFSDLAYLDLHIYNATDVTRKDVLSVVVKEGYSNGFAPGEDGLKTFVGAGYKTPEFSTLIYGANTIATTNDFRGSFTEQEEIPVNLWIKENGNYTIALSHIEGFDVPVYLVDKVAETSTELTPDVSYDFQASATGQPVNNRFALRAGAGSTTELPASVFNKTSIYAADNQVYIKNLTTGDTVTIYNVAGQPVETLRATSPDTSVALPAAGVYVVKVSGAESVVTKIINK